MDYQSWKSFYEKILADLKIDSKMDEKAAFILDEFFDKKKRNEKNTYQKLRLQIEKKEIFVFGSGNSLENSLKNVKVDLKNKTKIAADGATSALLKYKILPEIIVTDLDGYVQDQIKANRLGSIVVIHAHGDNIDKISKYFSKFKGEVIGTTQVDPSAYKSLLNFGGFTDGDRAVFLADHFNAKNISLIGFDFDGKIGKYSFASKKDKAMKLKKLRWCKNLLDLFEDGYLKYY
ncbi:MAG: DUF115 domain-containing protein [Candidatus Thermoplasmatota archaeon]|nr:DUF115 domain-containing protein [Candidatus Thermoplasmatota archaeon]